MEEMKIIRNYLHALARAEVVMTTQGPRPFTFNGSASAGDFNSRPLSYEMMAIRKIAEINLLLWQDEYVAALLRSRLLLWMRHKGK